MQNLSEYSTGEQIIHAEPNDKKMTEDNQHYNLEVKPLVASNKEGLKSVKTLAPSAQAAADGHVISFSYICLYY